MSTNIVLINYDEGIPLLSSLEQHVSSSVFLPRLRHPDLIFSTEWEQSCEH